MPFPPKAKVERMGTSYLIPTANGRVLIAVEENGRIVGADFHDGTMNARGRKNADATNEGGKARREIEKDKWAWWQAEADRIWALHEMRTVNDVANDVAKRVKDTEYGGSASTIRRRIKKSF
ncbi:MAG TPA: hypothetical protein VMV69_03645 [Pirellulales bacterium]|nr:hypothetical protein [Pirellulales bacterium]